MNKPFKLCLIFLLTMSYASSQDPEEVKESNKKHCRFYRALCINLLSPLCLNFCSLFPDNCHPCDCGEPEVFDVIIELPPVIDQVLAGLDPGPASREDKADAIVAALQAATQSAQSPYTDAAANLGLQTETFWGSNVVLVKDITEDQLTLLAQTPGSYTLRPPATVTGPIYTRTELNESAILRDPVQWGVAKIRAPQAWSVNRGAGCVVGIIDTGVNRNHVALRDNYAGAWSDPIDGTSGPTDQNGHGSHCAGIAVGRANGIGVAPNAKWIACRGLNNKGDGKESSLVKCGQFMLKAKPLPKVVSNSWGGNPKNAFFNQIVKAWNGAGIVPVFSIGNTGPGCKTSHSPGDQPIALISVGSTTKDDNVSKFSSRGPSHVNGGKKPELSAPGSDIVSAGTQPNNFVTLSGTSMAAPAVAGAVCLIITQHPGWTTKQVLSKLTSTAVQPNHETQCGGAFPNNAYGAGRIDVGAALGV